MTFTTERELFEYLEQHAYAAAFSDVMDEAGYRDQVVSPEAGIMPLRPDFVAAGRAVTLFNAEDPDEREPYDLVIRCIDEMAPDTLLVTTGSGRLITGIMVVVAGASLIALLLLRPGRVLDRDLVRGAHDLETSAVLETGRACKSAAVCTLATLYQAIVGSQPIAIWERSIFV